MLELIAPSKLVHFDLAGFARRMVIAAIRAERHNPTEMKARIMIAWEHGHFTAEEAECWIVLNGLQEY